MASRVRGARSATPCARGVIAGPRRSSAVRIRSLPHRFESFDAGHPFPNAASVAAGAARARARARVGRRADAALVVLLSGGASALLVAPVPGVTLEDKIATGARADARRRSHRRPQLRAQAPVADQGRPARRGRGADGRRWPSPTCMARLPTIRRSSGPGRPSAIRRRSPQALAIVRRVAEVPHARAPLPRARRAAARWRRRSSRMTRDCRAAPTRSSAIARPRSTARRRPRGRSAIAVHVIAAADRGRGARRRRARSCARARRLPAATGRAGVRARGR